MKCRLSHVTNSSSSSFIISKDQIDRDRLIEVLLEIANKEHEYEDEEDKFTLEDDVTSDCVAGRYHITEATKEHPLDKVDIYEYEWDKYSDSVLYDNHWVIDNESCGRYEWWIIDEILDKYGIEWERGYCD